MHCFQAQSLQFILVQLYTRHKTKNSAVCRTFDIQPPPSTVSPTPNPECSGSHNFEIAKHTCLSPGIELFCFLECTNVLRTSHCCICRLETVLATSSCDADPISTPNWSRKRHRAQGWMATSWLWYMNMCDKFCWDNPTWGRSENQRFKDPLSPMSFVCWFL